jgi:plasmid stabilization system protein ParE
MKVVYTAAALGDLAEIAEWLAVHYPSIAPAVERRIRLTVAVIGHWPESAQRSRQRPEIRVASVGKYPYRIFYRVAADKVEILHIHHAARRPWDEESP